MSDKKISEYLLTPQAEKDLEDIWFYSYETWSEHQADRYVEILEDTFVNLSFMPEQARELSEFNPPVRIFHVQNILSFTELTDRLLSY